MLNSIIFAIAIFGTLPNPYISDPSISGSRFAAPASCCNGKNYYNWNAFCCQGVLHAINDSDPKICCNDKIITNPYSTSGDCCNGKLFDRQKNLCCGKTLNPGSISTQCCGEKSYDYSKARCVNDVVKNIPTGITNANICKEEIFDEDKFICCQDSLIPRKTQSSTCCGKLSYDYETQLCCGEGKSIIAKPKTDPKIYVYYQCCGQTAYDANTKVCCNDKITNNPNYSMGCCGLKTYNTSSEFCCANKIYASGKTMCCKDVTYDPIKSFCCAEGLKPKLVGAQCAEKCTPWFGDGVLIASKK